MYRDLAYHGGVFSLFLYGVWHGRHGTSGFAPNNALSEMMKKLPEEELERRRRLQSFPGGSPHYADQTPVWADVDLIPMYYSWDRVKAEAESHQVIEPA